MRIQKNFRLSEFRCKCGCHQEGYQSLNIIYLSWVLQQARDILSSPIYISSGFRCSVHNGRVGGSPRSFHMHGLAADIRIEGMEPSEVAEFFRGEFKRETGLDVYVIEYPTFTHIDLRNEFLSILDHSIRGEVLLGTSQRYLARAVEPVY